MQFKLAVLAGDGGGPEITEEATKVLQEVGERFSHSFNLQHGLIGGVALDEQGVSLSPDTLKMCQRCDAVLLGAVGGPKWDDPNAKDRPEVGLLALRKGLKLFANLRPVKTLPMLVHSSNLKPEVVESSMVKSGFTSIETHFITPAYQDDHLRNYFNKALAGLMQVAAALSSAPAWQSFFVIIGKK